MQTGIGAGTTGSDRMLAGAVIAAVALAAVGAVLQSQIILLLALAGAMGAFAMAGDRIALFVLGFLYPFEGIRLYVQPDRGSLLTPLFPDGIDQTVVNVVALVLLLLVGVRTAIALLHGRRLSLPMPFVAWVSLITLSAIVSTVNAEDDGLLSLKYALYPIAFSMIAFTLLPSALAKGRDDVLALVRGMVTAGAFACAMGAVSLFLWDGGLLRARPLPMLGIAPLGWNHNLLAETLIATAPLAFALSYLGGAKERSRYRLLAAAMFAVALLTFARTAWIAAVVMTALAGWYGYRREWLGSWRRYLPTALLVIPLLAVLTLFSLTSEVRGSTASRAAMTDFSLYLFGTHPIIGAGAGTFLVRLGGAKAFTDDFGSPLDAHGIVQKVLSEQGAFGILALGALLVRLFLFLRARVRSLPEGTTDRRVLLLFAVSAFGMVIYELFNTTYWSAKLWLPVGLAVAAAAAWTGKRTPIG